MRKLGSALDFKYEYLMHVVNLLMDKATKYKYLLFKDKHLVYNKIFIIKEHVFKTSFNCHRAIEIFECVIMPFRLKNARAMYHSAMNPIFHILIGHKLEVYINDIVIKS